MKLETQKKFAAILSMTSNALIILLKLVAGTISGSISIISEAIHSISDFLASCLTFFAVSKSSHPADSDHPFGHGKFEDMSGFIEGGLIIFAGVCILYKAFSELISMDNLDTEPVLGIYVMSFSIISNLVVSSYLFYVAKKADSVSLYADAKHLRVDVFSSFGVLIGLVLIKITGITLLDPLIAIIVATIIIKAGYLVSKETLNNLLDGSLPLEDIKRIEQIIKQNPSVRGYKNLKARKAGHYRDIEITIFFDADIKLYDCHLVCDDIENKIIQYYKNANITIHSEPYTQKEALKKV